MIDIEDVKLWIGRRKRDIQTKGNMITQITITSHVNEIGNIEYIQRWEYIERSEREPDAKQMSGERNMWLVDRIDRKEYPSFATDDKRLTATGAYDFAQDATLDKIYKKFKDWEHIPIKTFLIAVLIIIAAAYGVYIVVG